MYRFSKRASYPVPARSSTPPILENRELAAGHLGPRLPPPKNKRNESRHGQRQSNGTDNGRRELFTQQAVEPAGVVQRVVGDAAGARARAALGNVTSALEAGRVAVRHGRGSTPAKLRSAMAQAKPLPKLQASRSACPRARPPAQGLEGSRTRLLVPSREGRDGVES